MNKLTKFGIAIAITAGAVFTAPLAANADPYTPSAPSSQTVAAAPGSSVTFSWPDGTFAPSVPVSVTITGAGADGVTLAVVKAAQTTLALGNSTAAGSLIATLNIPSDAAGTLNATFTDATGTVVTALIPTGVAVAAGGSGLAHTGQYISMLAIWGGAGVIVLGAALITVRVVNRRRTEQAG